MLFSYITLFIGFPHFPIPLRESEKNKQYCTKHFFPCLMFKQYILKFYYIFCFKFEIASSLFEILCTCFKFYTAQYFATF